MPLSVHWKNFRSLADTERRPLRPLTIVIGPNNSGKTSFIAPLLLLQQTLDAQNRATALLTKGPLLDLGLYEDLVRDHDPEARVELTVEWHVHGDSRDSGLRPLGVHPPGAATIEFAGDEHGSVRLESLTVFDTHLRQMLRRSRSKKTSRYSLTSLSKLSGFEDDNELDPSGLSPAVKEQQARITTAIRQARPVHFLFDGSEPILRSATARTQHPEDAGPVTLTVRPDRNAAAYAAIMDTVQYQLTDELRALTYIGPLRERAKRLYAVSGEMPRNVGTRGENAPEILFRWRENDEQMDAVHGWLRRFGFADQLVLKPLGAGAFSLSWRTELEHVSETAFVDMGFGLSQVLPLIVQGLFARSGSTIIAEQPEIHLNPRLQTTLAELFVAFVDRGVSVLTETHSEHLLLAVRRMVAEGEISADDVAIYFVHRPKRDSVIEHVELEKNGHIPAEVWPKDFFADALRESLALAEAQFDR